MPCPQTPPADATADFGETPVASDPYTPGRVVHLASATSEWWRRAVIYQVYPRSFRDTTGTGFGDLPGITRELHQIAALGVDALWLSPFFPSPQRDAGYDVSDYRGVDPLFGTLADFDDLVAEADKHQLRIIVDIVPNHCSDQHALFQAALAAAPGSAEREMFIFRDGSGERGELPPNNWQSHFGGSAWTRIDGARAGEFETTGQWYLHLFDASQPDFNWDNPAVGEEFESTLRFWLDRGAGGFRIDVAHALVKEPGLPDWGGTADGAPAPGYPFADAPMFGRPGVHDIYRRWRHLVQEYDGDRILCAEANVHPLQEMANWVRPDEMHQTFNFPYLQTGWDATDLRSVVTESLATFDRVGAPTTWVLSNHDVSRHVTRFGVLGATVNVGDGLGPNDPQPDLVLGTARARAATLFMLGLPGGAYLYQGEELGLGDHTTLPNELRQDPTYHRTGGKRTGRDGCRVPLPWTESGPTLGFSDHDAAWLPQPEDWTLLARDRQQRTPGSTLAMYTSALSLRTARGLGLGGLQWLESRDNPDVLAFINTNTQIVLNMGSTAVPLPSGEVLCSSSPLAVSINAGTRLLTPDSAVWLTAPTTP